MDLLVLFIAVLLVAIGALVQSGIIKIEINLPNKNSSEKKVKKGKQGEEEKEGEEIKAKKERFNELKSVVSNEVNSKSMMGEPQKLKVLYASQYGTSLGYAKRFVRECKEKFGVECELVSLASYDGEESLPKERNVVFILSTYTDGKPAENAEAFCEWLEDFANDFRVDKSVLSHLNFAVFGVGNSAYGENFNKCAKEVCGHLKTLSAKEMICVGLGDGQYCEEAFTKWTLRLWPSLLVHLGRKSQLKEIKKSRNAGLKKRQKISVETERAHDEKEELLDVEDLGKAVNASQSEQEAPEKEEDSKDKEMLTDSLRQSLTKQGYRLIGTHSGVKLCRWTKAMLRGRGQFIFFSIRPT